MGIRRIPIVISLFVMAVAAGCTTTSQGEPSPVTTVDANTSDSVPPSSSDDQDLPFAGAPKVDDPLDTASFQQDPCQALTADQTQELNLPPAGEPKDRPLGNACQWRNPETRADTEVHFLDKDPRGLSAEYQADEDGKWAYFEKLPLIEDYPAVARSIVDDRDIGRCTVVVGASDEIAFEVPVQLSEANVGHKEPCEAAAEVAGMALATMKKG